MTPWIVACQALLAMVFPRQEYWHGLPFPSPGDLPDIGIKPSSPELPGGFFTAEPLGKPIGTCMYIYTYMYVYVHTYIYTTAAAAKSLQSYLTLCDHKDGSPPGSPVPGILQARTL